MTHQEMLRRRHTIKINLAELFNNDEVFELKLNSGKILKNRKTTETFFDENGNLASKFEFFQGVNYVFTKYVNAVQVLKIILQEVRDVV